MQCVCLWPVWTKATASQRIFVSYCLTCLSCLHRNTIQWLIQSNRKLESACLGSWRFIRLAAGINATNFSLSETPQISASDVPVTMLKFIWVFCWYILWCNFCQEAWRELQTSERTEMPRHRLMSHIQQTVVSEIIKKPLLSSSVVTHSVSLCTQDTCIG